MARLWSGGSELQSVTAGVETDAVSGSVSISTTVKRSGAASWRFNPTSSTAFWTHRVKADSLTIAYVRLCWWVDTLPNVSTVVAALGDTSVFDQVVVRLETDGTYRCYNNTVAIGTASSAITTGAFHILEFSYDDNNANNTMVARLNGTEFSSANGADMAGWGQLRVGPQISCTCDMYLDDVAVNDSSGSAQTSWPGTGSIVHMHPDASGDNNAWLKQGGGAGDGNNYQDVDETTPDDATTYLKRITTGTHIDDYNCQTSASAGIGASDIITLVSVGQRAGSTSATSTGRNDILRIKSQASGTLLESASQAINVNGWTLQKATTPKVYPVTSYTDPQAGGAWTTSLLDSMQIGFRTNTSSANEIRVSTLWALVEYVPAAGVSGQANGAFGFTGAAAGVPDVQGAAAGSFGFTAPVVGHPIKHGAAVASFGYTGTAAGRPNVLGAAAAAFGFTATASGLAGTPPVTGHADGLFGFTGAVAGFPTVRGTAAAAFGFTGAANGVRRPLGLAVVGFGFTSTAAGRPRVVGLAIADFGYSAAGSGVPDVHGVATALLGFTASASGVAGTPPVTGHADGLFGFTGTAAGRPRSLGVGVAAFGFTASASGRPRVFGVAMAAFGFNGAATGTARVFGIAVAPFGFTASAAGGEAEGTAHAATMPVPTATAAIGSAPTGTSATGAVPTSSAAGGTAPSASAAVMTVPTATGA